MTFTDLSSTVCKFKAHKRCAVRSTNNCKWTTLASIGNDIIEDEEGVSAGGCGRINRMSAITFRHMAQIKTFFPHFAQVFMPHQWLEGNLPVSAKCVVCDKNCGSVRRLQDWRCLWCKAIVRGIDRCVLLSKRCRVKSVFVCFLIIIWGLCCQLESYFQFREKDDDTSE